MAGDVFLLGTHSWRIKRVESGRVRVEDAHGAAPSIPFWLGEAPGGSRELSDEVATLRERILADADSVPRFLLSDCGLDEGARNKLPPTCGPELPNWALCRPARPLSPNVSSINRAACSSCCTLLSDRASHVRGGWRSANDSAAHSISSCRLPPLITDCCFRSATSIRFPLELVFAFLKAATVEDVLRQALLTAPMFGARWRWNATRALAVLRSRSGARVPAPIQRMRADDLLASVFPDQVACQENLTGPIRIPDHPLVKETIDNCLHEGMDLTGLRQILEDIEAGRIRTVAIDTRKPRSFPTKF